MIQQISTIAWITCREALHGKLAWLSLGGVLLLLSLAEFAGEVVISGALEFQAGIIGWGLRWLGVLVLTLFCASSVARENADKITELLLAQPVRREHLYLGKLAGLALLGIGYALLAFAVAALYSPLLISASWAVSLWMELAIVSAFCLWVITATGSLVGTFLLTLVFYLLSRSIDALVAMATGSLFQPSSAFDHFMAISVEALSWVLPPLYEFASADWLISGVADADIALQFARAAAYLTLLGAVTVIELYRKQF